MESRYLDFSKTRFTERSGKVFKRNSKRFRRRELCSDQRCRKKTFVKEKQILYIKAETKYCDIILENQDSMFSDKSIGEWTEELEERGFFLCHRSYLVNLYHLKKIEDDILLSNGEKIPVSRRLKTKVKRSV